MGEIRKPEMVKYIAGLLLPGKEGLASLRLELEKQFGPLDLVADVEPFHYTDYYEEEMGQLVRTYVGFEKRRLPDELVRFKLAANDIENRHLRPDGRRSVNIDPGYLSLSQLVLASTKPFTHRIYLDRGIYAEVTLQFRGGTYQTLPWTYPDYAAHIPMFNEWREHYRVQKKMAKKAAKERQQGENHAK